MWNICKKERRKERERREERSSKREAIHIRLAAPL
jgi:hypothetical protein